MHKPPHRHKNQHTNWPGLKLVDPASSWHIDKERVFLCLMSFFSLRMFSAVLGGAAVPQYGNAPTVEKDGDTYNFPETQSGDGRGKSHAYWQGRGERNRGVGSEWSL